MQLGIDAFWGPVCERAIPDHKAKGKTTRLVDVNMVLTLKRVDAKMQDTSQKPTGAHSNYICLRTMVWDPISCSRMW